MNFFEVKKNYSFIILLIKILIKEELAHEKNVSVKIFS